MPTDSKKDIVSGPATICWGDRSRYTRTFEAGWVLPGGARTVDPKRATAAAERIKVHILRWQDSRR